MLRKRSSDPTFHPSKDTPHWAGDTTAEGQGVMLDQGEEPARLDLFGAQGQHPRNDSRLVPPPESEDLRREVKSIAHTQVPVADWRMGRGYINLSHEGVDNNVPGSFRPAWNGEPPKIGMTKRFGGDKTTTLVHEMGHAHHYDQPMVGGEAERANKTKIYSDKRGWSPDPLQEAVADAYVDRYGGRHSAHNKIAERHHSAVEFASGFEPHDAGPVPEPKPYAHISDRQFGYSSQYEIKEGANAAWDDADRVLYAGVRAHFDATGEIPHYQPIPGITRRQGTTNAAADSTIAMLHQHSKHARAAWENLTVGSVEGTKRTMNDIAGAAVRRHKDRQLLNQGQDIQESLFGEPELARNQHGDTPRTWQDIQSTIPNENSSYYRNRLNT